MDARSYRASRLQTARAGVVRNGQGVSVMGVMCARCVPGFALIFWRSRESGFQPQSLRSARTYSSGRGRGGSLKLLHRPEASVRHIIEAHSAGRKK
jgi:hypothetical protein